MDYRERGSHAEYLAHGNSKDEARGRNRHKNESKRGVRNLEERNVGTKRSRKQGLTIMLTEGRDSHYYRSH